MSLRRRILSLPKRVLGTKQKSVVQPLKPTNAQPENIDGNDMGQTYTIVDWTPNQPELWDWNTWNHALLADFTTDEWVSKIEVLADGIYRIPIFNPAILNKLALEIEALELWASEKRVSLQPPNSMHDYGIEMTLIGLEGVLQQLTTEIADKVVLELFPEVRDGGVDHHHAFSVTYGDEHNRSLGFHADDSEVTFNFCLSGEFIGSDLYFQGRRCFNHMQSNHRPEEHVEIEQIPGTCIVHAGLHRHGVLPILQGNRRSLIVWTKSSRFRSRDGRSECGDWCGEH